MMFDRPPMLGYGMTPPESEVVTNCNGLKDERIHLEGKWSNIHHLIRDLIEDGWRIEGEMTGEPSGFKFTEVTLER